jgi:NPCBM/NEW2 domain/Carboxypeptidase regulatory-like domain
MIFMPPSIEQYRSHGCKSVERCHTTRVRRDDWIAFIPFVFLSIFPFSAFAQLPSPEQSVVLDLHRPWLDAANADGNTPPVVYGLDGTSDAARFIVIDPNALALWNYHIAIPIDLAKYPILTMKYRARNFSKDAEYVLRLEAGDNRTRVNVWKGTDIADDEQTHELKQDLRELNPDGALSSLGIGLKSNTQSAYIEVLELKFSVPDGTVATNLKSEPPLRFHLADLKDKPIAGAKVIVDAERSNFAHSAQTDQNGDASVPPLANESQKHMVRVEKAGYATIEVANAVSESGQALDLKTAPAVAYGGIAQDANGKVIPQAQVSIKVKSSYLRDVPVRGQTNLVTNEQGEWKSQPLPADANQLTISLKRPDPSGTPASIKLDASKLQMEKPMIAMDAPPAAVVKPATKSAAVSVAAPAPTPAPAKPAANAITAIIQKVDDSTVAAGWTGVDGDQIAVVLHPTPGKEDATTIPLTDINELILKRGGGYTAPPAAPSTRPTNTLPHSRVTLANGDRMAGIVTRWSDKKVSLQPNVSPTTTIEFPVTTLRELWCGSADQIKKAQALSEQAGLDDIALVAKDDEVIAVHGIVEGIEEDSLHFRYDNADRKIGLNRLIGIIMAKADESAPNDSMYESVVLVNDDQISGKLIALEAKELHLQTLAGTDVRLPIDQIAKITTRNGRLTYLSDLKPTRVEQTPYFDRLLEYRVDKSLTGKPITLADGTYPHGISVHSRCVLTYDLGGRFDEFRTKVGFLLPEGKIGEAAIRVVADGKTLYENPDAKGDQQPADLKLKVAGAHELSLEVDYGKNDDVGDRIAWANARLLRAADAK